MPLSGVAGESLSHGDGIITPTISVLGAVEDPEAITPALKAELLQPAVVVITGLFMAQRFGNDAVGSLFGPIITLWSGQGAPGTDAQPQALPGAA